MKPYSFKETINSSTHISKEIYDAILGGNKEWRNLGVDRSEYKCIDRTLMDETLETSKCVKNMLYLANLEHSKQSKAIGRLQNLQSMEATKYSKNVESLTQQENLLRNKSITASNISITSVSYDEIDLPDPSETVIICDPPYRNTQGYQVEFDNDKFEQWCIDKSREGYEVFVCEYNIENPAFEEVWSKEVINIGGGNKNQKRSVEKLYYVK